MAFVLALIEHIDQLHPIDRSRIYIFGFSMGSMMTQAMAYSYPELFAAAAPCNAYNEGYFETYESFCLKFDAPVPKSQIQNGQIGEKSVTRMLADKKKSEKDYRMPVIQNLGLEDKLMDKKWPIPTADDHRIQNFDYWKAYNNIPATAFVTNLQYESGLTADETFYEGDDERFLHHRWFSRDPGSPSLYEILLAKRMPHALDLRQIEIAWKFMKKFSRNPDGSLSITE